MYDQPGGIYDDSEDLVSLDGIKPTKERIWEQPVVHLTWAKKLG